MDKTRALLADEGWANNEEASWRTGGGNLAGTNKQESQICHVPIFQSLTCWPDLMEDQKNFVLLAYPLGDKVPSQFVKLSLWISLIAVCSWSSLIMDNFRINRHKSEWSSKIKASLFGQSFVSTSIYCWRWWLNRRSLNVPWPINSLNWHQNSFKLSI